MHRLERSYASCMALMVSGLLVAGWQIGLSAAANSPGSQIQLYLSTLKSNVSECPGDALDVLEMLAISVQLDSLRAQFAFAYVSPDNSSLVINAPNPLRSDASVVVNNTLIVPSHSRYNRLGAQLTENNTLHLENSGRVLFNSSFLFMDKNNWLEMFNSTLEFRNSHLKFSNYFTWTLLESTFSSEKSLVEQMNTLLFANGSTIEVLKSTWSLTADPFVPAPGPYKGLIYPAIFLQNSHVLVESTDWTIKGFSEAHFMDTEIYMVNTVLKIFDSHVHISGGQLYLWRSVIQLYNSTLDIDCETNFTGNSKVYTVEVFTANGTKVDDYSSRGITLGDVPLLENQNATVTLI